MIAGALNRKKPCEHVYVAGPIGAPEYHDANAKAAMVIAQELLDAGLFPYVPHLCVWWERHMPQPYERWMEYSMAWLRRCDALYRIPGHSPGADREVVLARQHNIPVFFKLADVILWARK